MPSAHVTVGEAIEILKTPSWETLDGLNTEIPRAGPYLLAPRTCLSEFQVRLEECRAVMKAKVGRE